MYALLFTLSHLISPDPGLESVLLAPSGKFYLFILKLILYIYKLLGSIWYM